jgi:hypothetical protein
MPKIPEKLVRKATSVSHRIEDFFLANINRKVTNEEIRRAAKDPVTGIEPENWHQRLSELRTDKGYTILSWRDDKNLKSGEYMMPHTKRRELAAKRVRPDRETWKHVLHKADGSCEWVDGSVRCGLRDGEPDPIGGGTVHLTPDHKMPHSINPASDPGNPKSWQALCGRHQVMKKNFWDDSKGWLNVYAIVQAASESDKRSVYKFLKDYFGDK